MDVKVSFFARMSQSVDMKGFVRVDVSERVIM